MQPFRLHSIGETTHFTFSCRLDHAVLLLVAAAASITVASSSSLLAVAGKCVQGFILWRQSSPINILEVFAKNIEDES